MSLRNIRIHRTGSRINLIKDCDRVLASIVLIIGCTSIFMIHTFASLGFGVVLISAGMFLLQKMGRSDPLMREVGRRHIMNYRKFYPARATPFAEPPRKYK